MHTLERHALRQDRRRITALQLGKLPVHLGELRVAEPGADATGVTQFAPRVVIAKQQRAEAVALAAWLGEADHHELVLVTALDLEPIGAAPGPEGPVATLRDDAFEPVLADIPQDIGTAALLVVAVAHHVGRT